jgi:hypothetical protein
VLASARPRVRVARRELREPAEAVVCFRPVADFDLKPMRKAVADLIESLPKHFEQASRTVA